MYKYIFLIIKMDFENTASRADEAQGSSETVIKNLNLNLESHELIA
jgi:hypothetical protein